MKILEKSKRKFHRFVAERLKHWYNIGILIAFSIYLLSIGAIGYAVYEVCVFIFDVISLKSCLNTSQLLIVSLLSDFLLAFVLVLLARGIYTITQKAASDPTKAELPDLNLEVIEKNFIGIIILTMFVVMLEFTLRQEVIIDILYMGISVSILTIAGSIYISLSTFAVSKEEKKEKKEKEGEKKEVEN